MPLTSKIYKLRGATWGGPGSKNLKSLKSTQFNTAPKKVKSNLRAVPPISQIPSLSASSKKVTTSAIANNPLYEYSLPNAVVNEGTPRERQIAPFNFPMFKKKMVEKRLQNKQQSNKLNNSNHLQINKLLKNNWGFKTNNLPRITKKKIKPQINALLIESNEIKKSNNTNKIAKLAQIYGNIETIIKTKQPLLYKKPPSPNEALAKARADVAKLNAPQPLSVTTKSLELDTYETPPARTLSANEEEEKKEYLSEPAPHSAPSILTDPPIKNHVTPQTANNVLNANFDTLSKTNQIARIRNVITETFITNNKGESIKIFAQNVIDAENNEQTLQTIISTLVDINTNMKKLNPTNVQTYHDISLLSELLEKYKKILLESLEDNVATDAEALAAKAAAGAPPPLNPESDKEEEPLSPAPEFNESLEDNVATEADAETLAAAAEAKAKAEALAAAEAKAKAEDLAAAEAKAKAEALAAAEADALALAEAKAKADALALAEAGAPPKPPPPLVLDERITKTFADLTATLDALSTTPLDMPLFINQVKQIASYAILKNTELKPLEI